MPTEVNMRRSKLKREEAAILAGEVNKPSWESKNEGIHERVSFEDSIWGFDLAGGSFYKTPLRVTMVKPDSRADKAGIRPGDKLLRINDIDTSTLTIQEAHEIIIESGIHLRIAVTAPEDFEDSYSCWQDQLADGYDSEEERRREREKEEKRIVHCKVSSFWSLQWPWVSKRRIIYRESNCFMVPSKYEDNHKDKFTPLPLLKTTDDVVLNTNLKEENLNYKTGKTPPQSPMANGVDDKKPNFSNDQLTAVKDSKNVDANKETPKIDAIAEEAEADASTESKTLPKENGIEHEQLKDNILDSQNVNNKETSQQILENGEESNDDVQNDETVKESMESNDVTKTLENTEKQENLENCDIEENLENDDSQENLNVDTAQDNIDGEEMNLEDDLPANLEKVDDEQDHLEISDIVQDDLEDKDKVEILLNGKNQEHLENDELTDEDLESIDVLPEGPESHLTNSDELESEKTPEKEIDNNDMINHVLENGEEKMSEADEERIINDILSDVSEIADSINDVES